MSVSLNKSKKGKKQNDNAQAEIITAEEIEDFFNVSTSDIIQDMYHNLIDNCEMGYHGIFKNRTFYAIGDFFDLIKYNVDVEEYYKRKNKIKD